MENFNNPAAGRIGTIILFLRMFLSPTFDSKVWFNTPELCSGSNDAALTKIWY
jgi:hypothetical protein